MGHGMIKHNDRRIVFIAWCINLVLWWWKECTSSTGVYLVSGSSHDGREDGPGGVVPGEPGLAHAGPVIHDQGSNLVVTHYRSYTGKNAMISLVVFLCLLNYNIWIGQVFFFFFWYFVWSFLDLQKRYLRPFSLRLSWPIFFSVIKFPLSEQRTI